MAKRSRRIDRFFLAAVFILTGTGFFVFLSASLGLLAQNSVSFTNIALKQGISLGLGIIAFSVFYRIPPGWIKKTALFIFIGAILVNLLLFVPSLSLYHGGAARWLNIGQFTFQPSELLKIAFIIYLAAWIQFAKDKIKTLRYGMFMYVGLMAILGALLLAQSDTDTLLIIGSTGLVMLFVAGMPLKHIFAMIGLMAVLVVGVVAVRPYALQRVKTFFNRGQDTQGAGYQINQSLIAIGSGQLSGRGFGQSIQKFGYLPQPTDDSIFAVAAEEFGFIGSLIIISLYLMFAVSSFRVGIKSKDLFGASIAVGIAALVIIESFLNMAAMLGLVPLSGVPLLFISHGGTALIITLAATGIVASVSASSNS